MSALPITTPITTDLLRGALDVEHTARGVLPHRLPGWARAQYTDGQLAMVGAQPAGVRLAFRTGPPRSSWTRCPPGRPTPVCRPARTASTTCSSTAS
ncbi:hypothetical protein MRQ36_27290 [Micromonospora sp. R77]|uniref:hypothetical protein n=1 Tax=Micromonospora sp. R77 TaxID=2925836 RepID=UPI001F6223EA|nr:hypothetical protein [Micromonospora sp. R77]MCI4066052.1 hypothetical protein [Micromonospora sp. R77]